MIGGNVEQLERLLLEGFGEGYISVLDELVAEEVVEHQLGHRPGRDGLRDTILALREAFPDLSYAVIQTVEDEDKVWGHFRARGTNEGPFMGQPPTGGKMEVDVIDIARFKNGKVVEHWGVPDRLGILFQLGLLPECLFERAR